jgi:uncharacterized protein YdaT
VSRARDDYEESRQIPIARARARIWYVASRSTTIIIPPQLGHGHEVERVTFSTATVPSV